MSVLVTGASGFLGGRLAAALVVQGEQVIAPVRSEQAAAAASATGATVVRLDPGDVSGLRQAASACERAVHLAGPYRGHPRELVEAHVHGTARLLSALADGTRLVHVSSVAVYGFARAWPADPATPPQPWTVYGGAKLNAERQVRAWSRGEAVIVRPTITYGPGDRHGMVPRAWRLLRERRLVLPGRGDNRIHLLHVDDLVRGLLAALERGNGTYVLGGPRAEPVRDLFARLAALAGTPPPRFGLPAAPLRALGAVVESAWRLAHRDGDPPLTAHAVDVVTRDRAYDWQRAAEDLGWRPQVDLDEGLATTVRWLAGCGVPRPVVADPGPPWRRYLDDPDEGLGTVYERFRLAEAIDRAVELVGARSILHAPAFGMTGIAGLDCVFQARAGLPVGIADVTADRLAAIETTWKELGLPVSTTLLPWPDTTGWADALPQGYDLVVSFAALWWCADPFAVLAAQARVARRGVFVSVPNRTVAMAVRQRLWHRGMFAHLRLEALDPAQLRAHAARVGLEVLEEGFLDLPPFPDTAVPLRQVLTAARARVASRRPGEKPNSGVWRWSILPYLRGEQPDLPGRMDRLAVLERRAAPAVAERLAHHRYLVLAPVHSR